MKVPPAARHLGFLALATVLLLSACHASEVPEVGPPTSTPAPPEELRPGDLLKVRTYADSPTRTHACVDLVEYMIPAGSPVTHSMVSECTIRDFFEPGWLQFSLPDSSGVRTLESVAIIVFYSAANPQGEEEPPCAEEFAAGRLWPASAEPRPESRDTILRGFCSTVPPERGTPTVGTMQAYASISLLPGQDVADGVPCWTLVKYLSSRVESLPSRTVRCTLN